MDKIYKENHKYIDVRPSALFNIVNLSIFTNLPRGDLEALN